MFFKDIIAFAPETFMTNDYFFRKGGKLLSQKEALRKVLKVFEFNLKELKVVILCDSTELPMFYKSVSYGFKSRKCFSKINN